MFRDLGRFSANESGKITDQLVSVVLVVLVVGGLLITILAGMDRIWDAVRIWFCGAFPKVCG